MYRKSLVLLLTFLLIAACQPAYRQPVFDHAAIPTATPIPMPANPPRVAATIASRIQSFSVSPDLKAIALATPHGVILYSLLPAPELHAGTYLRTLNDTENVFSVAWSPDGSKLAAGGALDTGIPFYTGGDSSNSAKAHLTVWDTPTWEVLFEPAFDRDMVNEIFHDIAWSPDNRSLAASTDLEGVFVFDTQTGQVISRQTGFASSVVDLSWSPDGSRLVSTSDISYSIRRWRVSDNQAVRLFDPRVSNPMQVAWSPDGKRIASGHAFGGVCFWTAATNKCDGFIRAHQTATFSLAWSPDGNKLATGGGVIRIWDTHTGKLLTAFGEEDGYTYDRLEWPALDQPLISLQTSIEDRGETVVRFWDMSTGSILLEFQGQK